MEAVFLAVLRHKSNVETHVSTHKPTCNTAVNVTRLVEMESNASQETVWSVVQQAQPSVKKLVVVLFVPIPNQMPPDVDVMRLRLEPIVAPTNSSATTEPVQQFVQAEPPNVAMAPVVQSVSTIQVPMHSVVVVPQGTKEVPVSMHKERSAKAVLVSV